MALGSMLRHTAWNIAMNGASGVNGRCISVPSGPAQLQSDELKDSARRRLKHLGLMPKPLIFIARMSEHIVVAHRGHQLLASLERPQAIAGLSGRMAIARYC